MKQFDLFDDGQWVRARNALHDALAQADSNEAKRAHDELSVLEPSHRWLPYARTLIAALETPLPIDANDGLAILARLDGDWTEAADGIFGAGEHGLLVPFWRAVGDVLKGMEFDPERPDIHASHAWMKSGDWASAERCIQGVPGYRTQPTLLSRMAEAIWRQQRGAEAADHWFALCWLAPEEFQCLMERGGIPDRALRDGWDSGLDQDLEPAMTGAWFPAWMLLYKPELGQWAAPPTGTSAPEAAFDTLLTLTAADGENTDARRRLQQIHPGLLACFLSRR